MVAEREATGAAAKPRLVFAPPSREEAEEATTELRDAIERAYFNESPVEVVKEQDKGFNKQAADAIIPSMPGHVVQASTLLKSSPEAQAYIQEELKGVHHLVNQNLRLKRQCKQRPLAFYKGFLPNFPGLVSWNV